MPIGNQPPVLNREAAEKNKAASAIHLQGQFKAGQGPADSSAIQKLGAAFTGEQRGADVAATAAEATRGVAVAERDKQRSDIETTGQNIQNQEQLDRVIQDQKTKLIQMNIGITEDEFADDISITQLNENMDFQNDTQLNDLAKLSFESDEEYADMLQQSYQITQDQIEADAWELSVYDNAMNDAALSKQIAADTELAAKIKQARDRAAQKLAASKAKAGKQKKMIGAVKVAAGIGVSFIPGGQVAGTGLITSGAGEAVAAEG
jgi:hypothetical protein